jgi:hypothetical protein
MGRTKEIEVWIHKTLPEVFGSHGRKIMNISSNALHGDCIRAKLIIELPERNVTITESQFDDLCKQGMALYMLKEKLFPSQSEE